MLKSPGTLRIPAPGYSPAFRVYGHIPVVLLKLGNGLHAYIIPALSHVVAAVVLGAKAAVGGYDIIGHAELAVEYFFKRLQRGLFRLIAGEYHKSQRDAVHVHEHPHLDYRIGPVFL